MALDLGFVVFAMLMFEMNEWTFAQNNYQNSFFWSIKYPF